MTPRHVIDYVVASTLTVEKLRQLVDQGDLDTVVVAFTDMQGRLQGKRCHAQFFLDDVLSHGSEGCNYLLATDVEMDTVAGYATTSWDQGYSDFMIQPDLTTLCLVPWQPGTALVTCDLAWHDGTAVATSPRQILRRQIARLAEHGLVAYAGTELEFIVFQDSYEDAWTRRYQGMTPANHYNVDYSLLGTGRVEPLLRRIRNDMTGAGLVVESAKGECNLGQHEIAFKYNEALITADQHALYKLGAKEIAAQEGMSLTFMAKYDEREGNSCHIHLSVRSGDGTPVMAGEGVGNAEGFSPLMEHWLAGQLACMEEFSLLYAPNVNSYKRFVPGSFAPTTVAWGRDNRTCALRVVGHGLSLRAENRVPGGDVNPYLALAGVIAAGLHGVENALALEPEFTGNAYGADRPRMPSSLRSATALFEGSAIARAAFGDDVVNHYGHAAQVEQAVFDAAITDWERVRGFERL
jgi:glutamine synthetase